MSNLPMVRDTACSDERSKKLRTFFARYVTQRGGAEDPRIERAFAEVPREPFAGSPPWFTIGPFPIYPAFPTYTETPDDDPSFLYQDVLIALDRDRGINIGDPGLHAFLLAAVAVQTGDTVVHVGCGSGYYCAILARLVGQEGRVHAFEVDPMLAARAKANLVNYSRVKIHAKSGANTCLPLTDVIYVNAASTHIDQNWLRALRKGGRLLFPLQPDGSLGGMLLIQRPLDDRSHWPARFVSRAVFIAGTGLQDTTADDLLKIAFAKGDTWRSVREVRFDDPIDEQCWLRGDGWWLST